MEFLVLICLYWENSDASLKSRTLGGNPPLKPPKYNVKKMRFAMARCLLTLYLGAGGKMRFASRIGEFGEFVFFSKKHVFSNFFSPRVGSPSARLESRGFVRYFSELAIILMAKSTGFFCWIHPIDPSDRSIRRFYLAPQPLFRLRNARASNSH